MAKKGRPPTSLHGRLFGGDALYEVLAELARSRKNHFSTEMLATKVDRSLPQTRKEIRKLENVGAITLVRKKGKQEYFAAADNDIGDALFSLPPLLVRQLGPYRRRT